MKKILLATYDKATEMYNDPFFALTLSQSTREFSDVLKNPEHPMAQHPEDYSLFQLGTFNNSTGVLEVQEPKCVARAHELMAIAANEKLENGQ